MSDGEVSTLAVPDALRDYLASARYAVDAEPARLNLADDLGEIRYVVEDGGERGFALWRYDRGDPARWELTAGRLDDVLRYLAVELAPVARDLGRIEPVVFPRFADAAVEGWTLTTRDRGSVYVSDPDGALRVCFPAEDPHGVHRSVDFTHYGSTALDELPALLLTPGVPSP